jgi:DnaJ family protein A protein 5
MFGNLNALQDFSDSPNGFFTTVRTVFETLAREELAACSQEGSDIVDYPSFGHSVDDYEDVPKTFYALWGSFSTAKSFSWKDQFRYSEAPDRRVRRLMEKENKRLREDGIREFNDSVRTLVQFVKKRDPRYLPNKQSAEQRQKTLRNAAKRQAAKDRAANQAAMVDHVQPDWSKSGAREEDEVVLPESDEDESKVRIEFECVVCNKTFKSEKQFDAHERSKKHVKIVQEIKRQMQKEDRELRKQRLQSEEPSKELTEPLLRLDLTESHGKKYSSETQEPENISSTSELSNTATKADGELAKVPISMAGPKPTAVIDLEATKDEEEKDEDEVEAKEEDMDTIDDEFEASSSAKIDASIDGEEGSRQSGDDPSKKPIKKIGKAKEKRLKKATRETDGTQANTVSVLIQHILDGWL